MTEPLLLTAAEAAGRLGVSTTWLTQQLRARRFAATKIAGRWCMTNQQLTDAITAMSTTAIPTEQPSPAGLARASRFRRRLNTATA